MNVLIGYMLFNHAQAEQGWLFLAPFALAMLFMFLLPDHALHSTHGGRYDRVGRWLLAATVLGGWALNYFAERPRLFRPSSQVQC